MSAPFLLCPSFSCEHYIYIFMIIKEWVNFIIFLGTISQYSLLLPVLQIFYCLVVPIRLWLLLLEIAATFEKQVNRGNEKNNNHNKHIPSHKKLPFHHTKIWCRNKAGTRFPRRIRPCTTPKMSRHPNLELWWISQTRPIPWTVLCLRLWDIPFLFQPWKILSHLHLDLALWISTWTRLKTWRIARTE